MRSIWPITAANLRKGKGQAVALLVFVIIAAMLMNIGLLFMMRYGSFFEDKTDELNAPHFAVFEESGLFKQSQLDYLGDYPGVTELEYETVSVLDTDVFYNGAWMLSYSIFANAQTKRSMNDLTLIEGSAPQKPDDICLPYMFATGGGYQLGDKFSLTANGVNLSYNITGFTEEILFGSANNQVYQHYLSQSGFDELMAKLPELECVLIKVQLADPYDSEQMSVDVSKEFTYSEGAPDTNTAFFSTLKWTGAKIVRTLMPDIMSIVMVMFAALIVLVSLLVIRFRIRNSIEETITNIGMLKAMGYTGRQLLCSMVLQFGSITLMGIVLGIGISYAVTPLAAGIMAEQTALIWNPGFDIGVSLIAFAGILITVLLVTAVSARRIRTLQPLTALRQGLSVHAFKRNHFPLHRSRGGLTWLMAIKSALQNKGQMVMIFIIISIVSFATAAGVSIYINLGVNPVAFAQLIAGEVPDASVMVDDVDDVAEIRSHIKNDERVRKDIYFQQLNSLIDAGQGMNYIVEDCALLEGGMLYDGRYPIHDNEMALSGVAAKLSGKAIGDMVTVNIGGNSAEYLVTGLMQTVSNNGYACVMNIDAVYRIKPDFKPAEMYVYLHDNADTQAFVDDLDRSYGGQIDSLMNIDELMDAQLGMYGTIFRMVMIVIIAVTAAVIITALYLMLKTVMLRRRRELGIQKALGFTTFQLMNQLSVYFIPVIILGVAVGGIAGVIGFNPIFISLAQGLGIMSASMPAATGLTVVICVCLVLLSYAVSLLITIRIRKVSAYALVSE